MNQPKYLIVHHTAAPSHQLLQAIDDYHKDRFNMKSELGWYIGYHYIIRGDGIVTQCRKDTEEGAHTKRKNLESLGICLTGNFDKGIDTPNEKQINSLRNLLYEKATQYKIPLSNIVPHRKFSTKSCYGNSLSDNWASKLVLSKFQQLILALLDLLQRIKGRS